MEIKEKAKHTPGPWKVKNGPLKNSVRVIWDNPKFPAVVAEAYDDNSGNAMENAYLIAAAPELLEIAKAFQYFIENGWPSDIEALEINQKLEAAILNAEGR